MPATPTTPTRSLATGGTGPVLTAAQARQLTVARLHLTGFDTAVPSQPAVLGQFDELLLSAESATTGSTASASASAAFGRSLGTQPALVTLATTRTITLTARTGKIPITMLSAAPYTVVGTLAVSGDRFEFPEGQTVHMVIDHPTNPERISVQARTSGDLPLTSPSPRPQGTWSSPTA